MCLRLQEEEGKKASSCDNAAPPAESANPSLILPQSTGPTSDLARDLERLIPRLVDMIEDSHHKVAIAALDVLKAAVQSPAARYGVVVSDNVRRGRIPQ